MDHTGFTLIEEKNMPEVCGTARLWKHDVTGAQILSIVNDDENKCFGAAFRTPPKNSTGVTHIIEHSVLCGSRKYPVKEPFVNLLKGSLQTFLNAFTFPDKTCYPVASANLQDFYNLIDVYMDAVFHPLISENSFRQEGWHIEADSPDGPWQYKGVVFNEMKGVYSSPDACLAEETQHAVFPDTLYSLESGGRPSDIPSLTYQAYRDFYSTYYHPSNARFFFWGDDPEEKRLAIVREELKEYSRRNVDSAIPLQPPFTAPHQVEIPYAVPPEAKDPKCLFTLNWLLGERTDVEACITLEMLENILEGMPGSPLRRALISSGLGEDTTGGGLETELRQMYYSTGLKGIARKDIGRAETLIFDTLADLAEKGIPSSAVEAAVNTVEFNYRESNSGNFPRGLTAMLQALSVWLYDASPLTGLAWEAPLAHIKERLASGERVFENAIRSCFLENESRSLVILTPDAGLAARQEKEERSRLDRIQAAASPAEREEVCRITRELNAAQSAEDSPEASATIPNLHVSDLPAKNRVIPCTVETEGSVTRVGHELPTRGIAYATMLLPMPEIPDRLLPLLPLFTRTLTDTGTARRDYSELGSAISAKTGGMAASNLILADLEGGCHLYLSLAGKAVEDKIPDMFGLFSEMLLEPCRDKDVLLTRVHEMLAEEKPRLEQMLLASGHAAVMQRVSARFTRDGALSEKITGISYLGAVRSLLQDFDAKKEQILDDLETLRGMLLHSAGAVVDCTAGKNGIDAVFSGGMNLLSSLPAGTGGRGLQNTALLPSCPAEVFATPSQVNYVGKGCNLYALGWKFSGAAQVILRYLRMGYLWDSVRVKGGAYGVSCRLGRSTGNFVCTSYRDPNVSGTISAYDGIADYLSGMSLNREELERAIVGAIGDLDLYMLPDARGVKSLYQYLAGDTEEKRQRMREEMLSTTADDFRAFAGIMAEAKTHGAVSVIGGSRALEEGTRLGWKCENLF